MMSEVLPKTLKERSFHDARSNRDEFRFKSVFNVSHAKLNSEEQLVCLPPRAKLFMSGS